MELETKKAGVLELQAVNQQALLDIILEMGGIEAIAAEQFNPQSIKVLSAGNRALTYCLGWGVKNTPPQEALDTLEALGKPTHLPEIARANWLRYLALTNEETSDAVAKLMKLTFEDMTGGG